MSDIDQALLQLINVMNLVDLLLHFSPNFVISLAHICGVGGGERSNEMNASVCRPRRLIVSHTWWAAVGALSCWKIQNSSHRSHARQAVAFQSEPTHGSMRHWSSL